MTPNNSILGISSESVNALPEPILEDEIHVLNQCPTYDHLRESLSDELLTKLANEEFRCIFASSSLSKEFAKFVFMATNCRNDLINSPNTSD